VNLEQTKHPGKILSLDQNQIDEAFSKPVRTTNNITEYKNQKITLLNGMFTDRLGVEEIHQEGHKKPIYVSDIERTLIDITVRPIYSGGVYEVLKTFEAAKDKVSTNRLIAILKKMNFTYPYHQAIGFYLEKAKYPESSIKLLEKIEIHNNFYLTYQMKETGFSEKWKLFYPKGMEFIK
jgi:predicted transcriptional regulator of viral defense system